MVGRRGAWEEESCLEFAIDVRFMEVLEIALARVTLCSN